MFDIGWTELVVIGVVALLVIGPRELPQVLRTIGQWVGKARAMAREFHSGVSDMIRESELDELKKSAESAVRQFEGEVKSIDPSAEVEKSFNFDAPAAPGTPPASPADPDAPPAVAAAPPAPDPAKT